jgi:hypothetical protein
LWLTLPLTLGDLLASSLDRRSSAVATTAAVLAWALWTLGMVSSLVPRPLALTLLRILAPLPVLAGVTAAVLEAPGVLGWVGLGTAAIVAVAAFSADLGEDFIDGVSYGDERRMPLRPPAILLLGPLQGVWVLTVAPLLLGAGLLAAQQWVLGALFVVGGLATAWWGFQVLARLARRFVVFVPAGVTLVDPFALAEPALFRRDSIVRLGPAPAGSNATDLSAGATGLIVQIDLELAVTVLPVARRGGVSEPVETHSVLLAPTRPGAMLAGAESRRILVQRG